MTDIDGSSECTDAQVEVLGVPRNLPEQVITRKSLLWSRIQSLPRLTLFGRSLTLITCEILVNIIIWIVSILLFATHADRRRILPLCLIAWTLGLRHGLDADHLMAIDNSIRRMLPLGRLPVTVGLWFSLGHSTIVVAVIVAVVISTSVANNLDGVGSIGGVIGTSVSASFLFLLAIINSVILARSLKERRRLTTTYQTALDAEGQVPVKRTSQTDVSHANTCIGRIARPLFKLIDAPWKLYPVGVLFGLGFDTASEIALLGVSAIAKDAPDGSSARIPTLSILVLPLLFTCGMTLVDSLDSIGMLWAYASPQLPQENRWAFFERRHEHREGTNLGRPAIADAAESMMSNLSILLTIMSIIVALSISIIEFMGLAAQECSSCSDAAENDPGLAGKRWRFWNAVNDNIGFIGAGIIGVFVVVVATAFTYRRLFGTKIQGESNVSGEYSEEADIGSDEQDTTLDAREEATKPAK